MYLVTGATGNVGSAVVDQLLARGEKVRVFTRNSDKVARWAGRVQIATGDFRQPDSFAAAFESIEAAFLMNPGMLDDPFQDLLTTAKRQGTSRVVFLSSLFASDPDTFVGAMQKQKEDAILASGLQAAVLRPGGFMSNIFQWAPSIKSDGVIYNPMGSGQFAPIAPEDIAAVAVETLCSPPHSLQIYALTGGELITVPRQAEILSMVLSRPFKIIDITTEAAAEQMVRSGIPQAVANGVAKSLEAVRLGRSAHVSDAVARVTGQAPTTFEQWVQKHRDRFA